MTIQTIALPNLHQFKSARLRALKDAPKAFGSTYQRESQFSEEEWHARIERWNGQTGIGFLAIDGDAPCGIAGALLDPADPRPAELVSMWVAPEHRRFGVGASLVKAVIAWVRSQNGRNLRLMVTETNQPAIRFYESLGFTPTGHKEPYPNDPAIQELEMILKIS